jgi:hypothetical protein
LIGGKASGIRRTPLNIVSSTKLDSSIHDLDIIASTDKRINQMKSVTGKTRSNLHGIGKRKADFPKKQKSNISKPRRYVSQGIFDVLLFIFSKMNCAILTFKSLAEAVGVAGGSAQKLWATQKANQAQQEDATLSNQIKSEKLVQEKVTTDHITTTSKSKEDISAEELKQAQYKTEMTKTELEFKIEMMKIELEHAKEVLQALRSEKRKRETLERNDDTGEGEKRLKITNEGTVPKLIQVNRFGDIEEREFKQIQESLVEVETPIASAVDIQDFHDAIFADLGILEQDVTVQYGSIIVIIRNVDHYFHEGSKKTFETFVEETYQFFLKRNYFANAQFVTVKHTVQPSEVLHAFHEFYYSAGLALRGLLTEKEEGKETTDAVDITSPVLFQIKTSDPDDFNHRIQRLINSQENKDRILRPCYFYSPAKQIFFVLLSVLSSGKESISNLLLGGFRFYSVESLAHFKIQEINDRLFEILKEKVLSVICFPVTFIFIVI